MDTIIIVLSMCALFLLGLVVGLVKRIEKDNKGIILRQIKEWWRD